MIIFEKVKASSLEFYRFRNETFKSDINFRFSLFLFKNGSYFGKKKEFNGRSFAPYERHILTYVVTSHSTDLK